MTNETIKHQLNHRTIRAFKPTTLSTEQLNTLYSVASHTPTSMFMQQMSIMHITDPDKRAAIREISKQPYVGANGDLFILLVDLYRNQQIRQQKGKDDGRLHTADIFFQGLDDAIMDAQNIIVAAESMGLGVVPLGSIKNDPQKIIEVLKNSEKPLRPGEIAAALGADKDEVSKAIKELKAEEKIYSPVRCCYAVKE